MLNIPLSYDEITLIQKLKPNEIEAFYNISSNIDPLFSPLKHAYHPVLQLNTIFDNRSLENYINYYSECLIFDSMFIQSLLGYSIVQYENSIELTCKVIQQLLNHGLTYVTTKSNKLIILFPIERAMIFLKDPKEFDQSLEIDSIQEYFLETSIEELDELDDKTITIDNIYDENYNKFYEHFNINNKNTKDIPSYITTPLQKRKKDIQRVFRTKIKQRLSFEINTDVDYAIQQLCEYHKENCWITPELIIVWKELIKQKKFFIFELWYHDNNNSNNNPSNGDNNLEINSRGTLLAADFCHVSLNGNGCYVATRFHNHHEEYKTFQSGYILSILSCQYFQLHNFKVWDLGGVDFCPLMRYKYDLVEKSVHRSESVYYLNQIKEMKNNNHSSNNNDDSDKNDNKNDNEIETGVIIENVTIQHLWN